MTSNELAEHFEVSKRTILRDIETLSMAGIPIYTTQGKGGGISIQERFLLNKAVISEDEQKQILFALQSMKNIETENILSRLQNLFQTENRNWIEVDFSRWGNSADDRATYEILKSAIISKRALTCIYSNSCGAETERKIHPLKLVFKSNAWYLQAFCLIRNGYRTFKVVRMKNIEMLDESFDGNNYRVPEIEADMDPPMPCRREPTPLIDVKLHFASYEKRIFFDFDEREISENADGSYIVETKVSDDYRFIEYILQYGTSVEVIEPQKIRDIILHNAETIKNKYAEQKSLCSGG
jgi:predicted DNA-binding transcriptional regulator YafY